MSHFTRVKTKIADLQRLKTVLAELGYTFREAAAGIPLLIKGWEKQTQQVELAIETGCAYSVGVIVNADSCELVADWWGIETYTGITRENFINKITKKYAYNTVIEKIRKQGYAIVSEEVDAEQNIKILVRKWE